MKDLMKHGWNILSGKNEKVLLVCNAWIFPLTFTFSYLLNIAFYYLGLASTENPARRYGFILGSVLFAAVCLWVFFQSLRKQKISAIRWILLGLVAVFFGLCFVMGILNTSTHYVMLGNAKTFCFFAAPAFLAGIVAAVKKTEDSFFGMLEKLSFFALPAATLYTFFALLNCNPYKATRGLGILHYMTFAYTLMPLFLALLLRFADKAELPIPFTNRHFKRPQLVRGIMIAIYWIALIATGTRGMYICVTFFCLLLVISRFIHREPAKRACLLSLVLSALLLFNMFIYAPPGMHAVSRMSGFVQSLLNGKFNTTDTEGDDAFDLLTGTNQPSSNEQTNDSEQSDEEEDQIIDYPDRPALDPDASTPPSVENIKISNRGTLYKLTFSEFVKAPVFGMGPGGYSGKYGIYPHNAFMEILCETGLVGCLILFPLLLLALIKLCIVGWTNKNIWYIFIFMLTYVLQINISGTVWNCPALLCTLGYGLAMPLPKRENRLKLRR